MRPPRICFVSLGCPKNTIDSEKALGAILSRGAALETDPSRADWIILNTCGFISSAKRESLETFFDLAAKRRKNSKMVLAGCLPSRYGDELAAQVPEADLVLGVLDGDALRRLEEAIFGAARCRLCRGFLEGPRLRIGPRHRAYLKIAEGCDNRCSYCAIPAIRGPLRSRPLGQVVEEARGLAASGVKELIVVAQDTTNYGVDLYGRRRLADLLERLDRIDGLEWIRLMYAHPAHLGDEILKLFVGLEKLVHYIDLPLQHAATEVLRAMGRKVTLARVEGLLDRIRGKIPDMAIRTTFMVGFPGESPRHFETLLKFVERQKFDHAGAFVYSSEEGTGAARSPAQVPFAERRRRRKLLMQAQQRIVLARNRAMIGRRMRVLVDAPGAGKRAPCVARSYREAPEVDSVIYLDRGLVGRFVHARISGARGYDLEAKTLRESS